MKVITILIRKGGSGKTTTATNVASALAKAGKRVLLLDLDSQANATLALGIDERDKTIANVLAGRINITDAIQTVNGIDLIASSADLAAYEPALAQQSNLDIISRHLRLLGGYYDYIIIDTPPADNGITRNALIASDYALIPAEAQTLALRGVAQARQLVHEMKPYNNRLQLLGILPTKVQTNTVLSARVVDQLRQLYQAETLPYQIPLTIRISESQLAGKPLVDYDPAHPASEQYRKLAAYIIERANN